MKVALGFFGQPRIYQHYHSGRIIERIIDRYQADVYCHAWWSKEETNYSDAKGNTYSVGTDVDVGLEQLYSPKKLLIEPSIQLMDGDLVLDEVYMQHGKDYRRAKQCPSSPVYMSGLLSQKRLYALVDWEQYDWIIRWRYDADPEAFPDLTKLPCGKMYVLYEPSRCGIFSDSAHIIPSEFREMWNLYEYLDDYLDILFQPPPLAPPFNTLDPEHPHLWNAQRLGIVPNLVRLPPHEFNARILRTI